MIGDRLITCARLAGANDTVMAVGEEPGVGAVRDALARLALRKAAR